MYIKFTNQQQQQLTLKKFLQQQGISHRLYQKLKQQPASFLVNQRKVLGDYLVQPQDQVQIQLPMESDDPKVATSYQPLTIVYEDDNFLVVNKPQNLSSVPGPSNREDTLVNRIKGHLKQEHSPYLVPHLITRLDFDTQGLVLVAKHLVANSLANQLVAKHQITKYYYAMVAGKLEQDHAVINQPIGQVPGQIARQVLPDGKTAITEFWVLQRFLDKTLVKVQLHTGRTHQIRVHFASLQHPLLGDRLYHGPLDQGFQHQALQAYYLQFVDPIAQLQRTFELKNCLI